MRDRDEWMAPGAHPVADGVYRIPLPLPQDGLRAVNVYALETDLGLVLVDGGWALEESRSALEAALGAVDHKLSDVTQFLVTHVHRDHYTQAVTVRREFGSKVSLGLGERPSLEVLRNPTEFDPRTGQLHRAGAYELAREWAAATAQRETDCSVWESPDEWLVGEPVIDLGSRVLQAVTTPGHTQGHLVFADLTEGLLFAGDHVLPTITPSIGFESVLTEQPLGDFLTSLAKVRAMPDTRLLPAHGPVAASTHTRIDELLVHHADRLARCAKAVREGARSADDVAGMLPWTRRHLRLDELDVFNRMLAVLETLAHLDLLSAQGQLRREQLDETSSFRV